MSLSLPFSWMFWSAHIWTLLLRLPKALAPTLVGTKLLLPIPPDRLRKSARRWVTQVAVLQARFCAVTLLQESKQEVNVDITLTHKHTHTVSLHTSIFINTINIDFTTQKAQKLKISIKHGYFFFVIYFLQFVLFLTFKLDESFRHKFLVTIRCP